MNRATRRVLVAALVGPAPGSTEPSAGDQTVDQTGADGTVDLPTVLSAVAFGGRPGSGERS